MEDKNSIHISVASNNSYAVFMAVLLKSIIYNHHSDEKIVFYILNDNISIRNQSRINSLILKSPEIEIIWMNAIDVFPIGMKFPVDNSVFPHTTYLKLFAPYKITHKVKKIIHFDVDMIVRKDVSELWNIDLNGHIIAASLDIGKTLGFEWDGLPNYTQLCFPSDAKYFNSGLMIIDTAKWREYDVPKKVFKVIEENINNINYADQDGLNNIFAHKWLEIDPLWNWCANNFHSNAKNVHFLDIKPIFKTYKSDENFKKEFFKYLDMTPWKGISLKSDYVRLFHNASIKIKKQLLKLKLFNARV